MYLTSQVRYLAAPQVLLIDICRLQLEVEIKKSWIFYEYIYIIYICVCVLHNDSSFTIDNKL